MDQALGTLKDGRIVLDEQPNWPEGQRVWVMLCLDDEMRQDRKPRDKFVAALEEVNRRYSNSLRKLAE